MACDLPSNQLTEARQICNENTAATDPQIQAALAGCVKVREEYERIMTAYKLCQAPSQATKMKAIIDTAISKK